MSVGSQWLYPPYGVSVFRKVAQSRVLSFENKPILDVIKSFFFFFYSEATSGTSRAQPNHGTLANLLYTHADDECIVINKMSDNSCLFWNPCCHLWREFFVFICDNASLFNFSPENWEIARNHWSASPGVCQASGSFQQLDGGRHGGPAGHVHCPQHWGNPGT